MVQVETRDISKQDAILAVDCEEKLGQRVSVLWRGPGISQQALVFPGLTSHIALVSPSNVGVRPRACL